MDGKRVPAVSIKLPVKIEQVAWLAGKSQLEQIRKKVFVEEQGVSESDEWDDKDDQAWHFLAYSQDSKAVACARLLPEGKLTRMAVLTDFRGLGIGKKLLHTIEVFAASRQIKTLHLDAQIQALNFYQRLGYKAEGDVFLDAGIEHLRMQKSLESDVLRFSTAADAANHISQFATEANRSIDIFSHSLSPLIYGSQSIQAELSRLARRGRNSTIRILVRDTKPLNGVDHPLVSLAKRLPSSIQVKQYIEGAKDPDMGFFCVDGQHLVYFSDEANFEGFARRAAKAESKSFLEEFDYLWQNQSRRDPNLRDFRL